MFKKKKKEIFYILIVVGGFSGIYIDKTLQTGQVKWVHFVVYKLNINKVDFKCSQCNSYVS